MPAVEGPARVRTNPPAFRPYPARRRTPLNMIRMTPVIRILPRQKVPLFQKISYTFLSLEKRPRHVQDCYTAQKMRQDLLFLTHKDLYHLNNYQSLYALISRHSL